MIAIFKFLLEAFLWLFFSGLFFITISLSLSVANDRPGFIKFKDWLRSNLGSDSIGIVLFLLAMVPSVVISAFFVSWLISIF